MSLPTAPAEAQELPSSPATTNGQVAEAAARPQPSKLPKGKRRAGVSRFVWPLALVALAASGVAAWGFFFRVGQARTDLSLSEPLKYTNLQLKIVERGTLEARENHDVKCEVKAGSRGAPKLKWVVENGTQVAVGDMLAEIEDSYLVEQAQGKQIDRQKAENDMIAAETLYPVKQIAITLAEKNLEKWIKGDYPQQLHDLEGQIQTAESAVLQQEDRTSWAGRMVKKGYMTPSQLEAEEANLKGYKLTLQQNQEKRKVLLDYTDPVNRRDFENKTQQAKVDERTAFADMKAKEAIFKQQDDQYKDLLDQIKLCKVKAQHSGIVVYAVPEQTRMGAGSQQSIIAQGEPVQYGQKMMSIPDLSHMLVSLRIHEAFINYIRPGLPVTVRVDALSGETLKGHVKSVDNVAQPQDWMSPDVKVYKAYVEIDDTLSGKGLKPGLSAVCTIYTDRRAEHTLAVPLEAVIPSRQIGGKPRCFVYEAGVAESRELELGLSDSKYYQVLSGLNEGDVVVLNPSKLLNEKEKKVAKDDDKTMPTGQGKGGGKGGPGGKGGFDGGKGVPGGGKGPPMQ